MKVGVCGYGLCSLGLAFRADAVNVAGFDFAEPWRKNKAECLYGFRV